MKTKGIRILDKEDDVVSVRLQDILQEVQNGNMLFWSILFLNAIGGLGEEKSIPLFMRQINDSEKGFSISWKDLNLLPPKFDQILDIVIIGCYNEKSLHRYKSDRELYETCGIYIEMVDSSFWEVFSKDESLIDRLAMKFKDIKFLESNFEK